MGPPAFEALISSQLVVGEGGEPYGFSPAGVEALEQGFAELTAGPHARAEVEAAVRWVVALQARLDSPSAAARLRDLVHGEPNAAPHLAALAVHAPGAIDGYRAFLEAEGRNSAVAAPSVPQRSERTEEGDGGFTSPLYTGGKKPTSPGPRRLRRGKLD